MKSLIWASFRNRTIFQIVIAGFGGAFFRKLGFAYIRGLETLLESG